MNVAARMYKALKQEDGITRVIREDREVVHHSQSVHASVVSLDAAGFGSTACCAHFRVCRRSSSMAVETDHRHSGGDDVVELRRDNGSGGHSSPSRRLLAS